MTKKNRLREFALLALCLTIGLSATAQLKVGDNPTTINANSALEIESTNKGLLLPRLALTSTTSFNPLTAHIAGMTVYNTATAADVAPGFYYNDGTKWVRLFSASTAMNTSAANNLVTITNGTGATLTAMTVGVDTTQLKSFLAGKVTSVVSAPLTGNGTTASPISIPTGDLSAGTLLTTTGTPTSALLKSAGYNVDTTALKTFISNAINNGAITGKNTTSTSSLITLTNNTGATLTAMTIGMDTTVLKTFLAGKVSVVASSPLTGNGTTASPLSITTNNTTAGSLVTVTNGSGATFTAMTVAVDTTALKSFISNTITNGGINGQNLTAGSLLQTTGTPTGASLKTAGYQVDTTALKTFMTNTINNGGITGKNTTAGSLVTVTNGTGASLTAMTVAVDTSAMKSFLGGKVTSATTAPITGDGTAASPISVTRATATSGVLTTVTNGANAAFTALQYDVDTTALKSFISSSVGKNTTAGSLVTVTNGTGAAIKDNTVAVDTTALKTFLGGKVTSATTAPITGDGTTASPISVTRATATNGVLTTVTNGVNAAFTALQYDVDTTALKSFISSSVGKNTTAGSLVTVTNGTGAAIKDNTVAVDTTALKTFINGRTTNTLASATNTITSTVNGVVATAPAVNTVANSFTVATRALTTTVNGVAGTAVTIPNGPDSTLANNGLSMTGDTVQLGGALIQPTTITTTAANTLALTGLQRNTSSDTLLMTTGGGVVRNETVAALLGKYGEWVDGDSISKTGLIYARQAMKVGSADTVAIHDNGTISLGMSQSNGGLYVNATTINTALHQLANYGGSGTLAKTSIIDAGTQQDLFTIRNDYDGTSMHEKLIFNYRAGGSGNPYVNRGQIGIVDNSYINTIAGNFGVGTTAPTNKLHISATSNPLRLAGLQTGAASDSILTADATGVVRKVSASSLSASKTRSVVTTTSAAYTIADSADVVIYTGTANATFTLPAASAHYGRELRILNYAAAATNTTISLSTPVIVEGNTAPETSTIINSKDTTADFPLGIASRNINTITLISNGTDWYKLGN